MAKTATRSKKDILKIIQAHADQIQLYGIQRLGIFGSFAREQQTSDSDIDLLVDFKAGQKNYDNFINLAYFLEDTLQLSVELLTQESLSPLLKPHILKEVENVLFYP